MYILSLTILFLLLIVATVEIPHCSPTSPDCKFIGLNNISKELFKKQNIISILLLLAACYGSYIYRKFDRTLLIAGSHSVLTVKDLKNVNYDHLTFLATYIIPLTTLDLSKISVLVLFLLLLLIMGIIYIRTDLFYANPSLALMGFSIYRVTAIVKSGQKEVIVITKGKIKIDQKITYIQLDSNIFYGRVEGD